MKLFLASGNPHKVAEFQALAAAVPATRSLELLPASAAGGMPAVAEDTGSFHGNALKKARALRTRLPPEGWALADDSGLCVDALDGAPGVESAYYSGPGGDAGANLAKLVRALAGVPDGRRAAHFICCLALVAPDGTERLFEGQCPGRLLHEPRGVGGFGYDPLFVPEGLDLSFAELERAVKNAIGHRGRAWTALMASLEPAVTGSWVFP
jgi:XTP/dITP diphosphohydrolase